MSSQKPAAASKPAGAAGKGNAAAQPAAGSPTLAPGTVLADRFEIQSVIGEGGMGVVYRALDRAGEKPAAVKVLKKHLVQSKEFVTRFKREARAASRFRHEAAVKVLLTGETEEKLPWLAMELVEGKSVKEIMEAAGRLEPGRACNLAHQLLRALGSAHRAGIVHRDMKPDNIRVIVDADGIERPKILDFGIAKFVRGEMGEITGGLKTKTGVILGTPKYMAPEQIRGDAVDGRADIYSVGAMLYEMLGGKPPFEAADVFGFVAMHLKEQVPPLTQRFPDADIPHEVDEVVLRMLTKDAKERPADATALADELEKFAVEDPTKGKKAVELKRGVVTVAVAGVVAAGAAFALAPAIGLASAPAALGLGLGAAIAAAKFGRPSVYSYVKRVGAVAGTAGLLCAIGMFVPGSPGLVTASAFALAAVLCYAAFLVVWNSKTRALRVVMAGLAAPLLALALFPVHVKPPAADQKSWYLAVWMEGSDVVAKAELEKEAKKGTALALAAMCLVFGAASVALPRPGAARLR